MLFFGSNNQKKAFSVVEIVVAIVIICFALMLFILSKRLIGSAKATKINRVISAYRSAINEFYDVYGAYPGDVNPRALPPDLAAAKYRPSISGGDYEPGLDMSGYGDGLVVGCDSRDGFKQLALAKMIAPGVITSTLNPNTTVAKCAILDDNNNYQGLPISTDLSISLPSIDFGTGLGIYYSTVVDDINYPNNTILGAGVRPGDILLTVFGGLDGGSYADLSNLLGIGSAYAGGGGGGGGPPPPPPPPPCGWQPYMYSSNYGALCYSYCWNYIACQCGAKACACIGGSCSCGGNCFYGRPNSPSAPVIAQTPSAVCRGIGGCTCNPATDTCYCSDPVSSCSCKGTGCVANPAFLKPILDVSDDGQNQCNGNGGKCHCNEDSCVCLSGDCTCVGPKCYANFAAAPVINSAPNATCNGIGGCMCTQDKCYCKDTTSCKCTGSACINNTPNAASISSYVSSGGKKTVKRNIKDILSYPTFASVSPVIAMAIDQKFDDGMPLTGKIIGTKPWSKTNGAFGTVNGTTISSSVCNSADTINPPDFDAITYVNSNNVATQGCLVSFTVG